MLFIMIIYNICAAVIFLSIGLYVGRIIERDRHILFVQEMTKDVAAIVSLSCEIAAQRDKFQAQVDTLSDELRAANEVAGLNVINADEMQEKIAKRHSIAAEIEEET